MMLVYRCKSCGHTMGTTDKRGPGVFVAYSSAGLPLALCGHCKSALTTVAISDPAVIRRLFGIWNQGKVPAVVNLESAPVNEKRVEGLRQAKLKDRAKKLADAKKREAENEG